jgi:hypothetical protein
MNDFRGCVYDKTLNGGVCGGNNEEKMRKTEEGGEVKQ